MVSSKTLLSKIRNNLIKLENDIDLLIKAKKYQESGFTSITNDKLKLDRRPKFPSEGGVNSTLADRWNDAILKFDKQSKAETEDDLRQERANLLEEVRDEEAANTIQNAIGNRLKNLEPTSGGNKTDDSNGEKTKKEKIEQQLKELDTAVNSIIKENNFINSNLMIYNIGKHNGMKNISYKVKFYDFDDIDNSIQSLVNNHISLNNQMTLLRDIILSENIESAQLKDKIEIKIAKNDSPKPRSQVKDSKSDSDTSDFTDDSDTSDFTDDSDSD